MSVAIGACGSEADRSGVVPPEAGLTTVSAADYEQACSKASDCAGIAEGSVCGPCGGCPNAAVASSALPTITADITTRATSCPPVGPASCGACYNFVLTCVAGMCGLRTCDGSCPGDGGSD